MKIEPMFQITLGPDEYASLLTCLAVAVACDIGEEESEFACAVLDAAGWGEVMEDEELPQQPIGTMQ